MQFRTFECAVNKLVKCSNSLILICIYRLDWEPCSDFLVEFCSLIESLCSNDCHYIIAGDFNIHVDCPGNTFTVKLEEIITNYNMKQWVSSPTHRLGHILDLIITPDSGLVLSNVVVNDISLSDHFLIHFNADTTAKNVLNKDIFVTNYKK